MKFLLFILPSITFSQNFIPNITLVPGQSIVTKLINYDKKHNESQNCSNIQTYQENEDDHEYIQIKPEYFNIDIIALQRIYCIYLDSFTYLFAILFNNTLLSLRLNDPKFFSDDAQQTFNLSNTTNTTIDSCYEMHRVLDNTKFDIICVNNTHRIFVELFNNIQTGFPIQNLDYKLYVIKNDNQLLRGRTLRNSSIYYIALFNTNYIELYMCKSDCQQQNYTITDLQDISDIQLLSGYDNNLKFAISLRNSGFYIYNYNFTTQQNNQLFKFKTYNGQQYLNLCVYSYTLWYGNDPSSIYPEIVLLTNNFVHIFKYLNKYNDVKNILISSKRFQIGETKSEDYLDYLINQDDKYVYITRRNKQNQILITYVQKSKDDSSIQQFPSFISDERPFITVYDMINKTPSLYNKIIHIYSSQNSFVYQQINKIQDNVLIIKYDSNEEINCTLNNNTKIETIYLNSTRILNVAKGQINFNTLVINQNMQEVFKGQLLRYSANVTSKRINSYFIDIDKQVNNLTELIISYPQQVDQYCVTHSVYDPFTDLSFTLYQVQNKTVYLFSSYEVLRLWNLTGYLNKFEQIEDYLLFSYYENESQTNVTTIIYDWRANNSSNEIRFDQDQFKKYTSIDQDLEFIQQLSHFNQKIIYYFIKTNQNKFYMIYFRFLDKDAPRLCIQFEESQYEIYYILFDLQGYNLFIASAKDIKTGYMALVYFRLPIIEWDGCQMIKLFQIYIDDIKNSKDIEFWLVDYQFIDIEQPISIVIMDFTMNTLTKYSIRDLVNTTYKQEKFPLPIFDNIILSYQKYNDTQIIGNNEYLRKGSLYYCRVIYQYLILNIVENNILQKIYKYDLLGESGNQVQLLYDNQNKTDILIYFPKAYLSQQTKKSLKEILRYGQGTITSNPTQQTFYNLSFNYKEVPTFQINLRTDQYFQSHIFGYNLIAQNNNHTAIQNITIRTENLDINSQIINSSQIDVKSNDYINLSMFQGPSLQYFLRDKVNKKEIKINFTQELKTVDQNTFYKQFEKYINCQDHTYILIIQGEYQELIVQKLQNQSVIEIANKTYNISEVDGLCFNTTIQITAIQKIQEATQIVFFYDEFSENSSLKQLDLSLSPVNIEVNNQFNFQMLNLYNKSLKLQQFYVYVQSQNIQYIFEIQHLNGTNQILNYSFTAGAYQYLYQKEYYGNQKLLSYNKSDRVISFNDKIFPIYFDFDFIPTKPIIINDSLIVFTRFNNQKFGMAYYDLTNNSSMKQYVNITDQKVIDVEFDPNYNIIIVKCINRTYYYTIKPKIKYSELLIFLQKYQDNKNNNYQLCSETREKIKYNKCVDLELENYDRDKLNFNLSLFFYFAIIPTILIIMIINIIFYFKIRKTKEEELNNPQLLRNSHNISELIQ